MVLDKEVQENYPLAVVQWVNYLQEKPRATFRDMYDFFDSQNLNIVIHPEYYADGINWNWQIKWILPESEWIHDSDFPEILLLVEAGTMMYGDNGEYDTRIEAEKAAFTKAFEILEERLK